MRFLKYVLVTFCFLATLGCYEVNEEIAINENGSGIYNSKMDMSALIEMMQTFAGEEKMAEEGLDRAIDTVVNFSSFIDSAKDLTAAQKEMMQDGKMRMQLNVKEKVFKMDLNIPYKNFASLQKLLSSGAATGNAMSGMMKGMFGGKNGNADSPAQPQDFGGGMNDLSGFYDVVANKNVISRKVNAEKFQALLEKPEIAQMKQLSSSGMEILYTLTLRLPRPVKSSDNPIFKLSDDKKTVTMKYNMLEMLETPEKFSYTIEY